MSTVPSWTIDPDTLQLTGGPRRADPRRPEAGDRRG